VFLSSHDKTHNYSELISYCALSRTLSFKIGHVNAVNLVISKQCGSVKTASFEQVGRILFGEGLMFQIQLEKTQ